MYTDGYKKLTYTTILNKSGNFLSLDISVNSTGWILKTGNEIKYGTFGLQFSTNRERRNEFANNIKALLQEVAPLDFIVMEDVIMGTNFRTTRALIELNTVVETLIDYSVIPNCPVYRLDNTVWKRILNRLSQDETLKGLNDKERAKNALISLGFCPEAPQDVYDAMGLVLAWCSKKEDDEAEANKAGNKIIKPHKLHYSLTVGYDVKQYPTYEAMCCAASAMQKRAKRERQIIFITPDTKYKDLVRQFKDIVEQNGDEAIFCFTYPLNKIGSILITKDFDLTEDIVYFIARLR